MRSKHASPWFELAREELSDHERVEVSIVGEERGASGATFYKMKSLNGRGRSGESRWSVFKNEADAEKQALAIVKKQLQTRLKSFSKDWLQGFIQIDPATAREIAADTASRYLELRTNVQDILFEAGTKDDWEALQESIDEAELDILELEEDAEDTTAIKQLKKLHADIKGLQKQQEKVVADAREAVRSAMETDTLEKIQSDPVGFIKENDIDISRDNLPNWLTLDLKAAAQDAVERDGAAHFLDIYNGAVIKLNNAVAYGQS
jgi:hypothetical protein